MANTEHKQIPHVQWHTPHFCPLLDVTNTRGGRAKGRTLSDLVIQNFSNMLSAVWDYSRLPMRWVSNTRCAAKQLPGKPRWRKREKQPCAHPYRQPVSVCLSGTVYTVIFSQLSLCYATPTPLGKILSGAARDQANAENFGTEKPRVLLIFPLVCSR